VPGAAAWLGVLAHGGPQRAVCGSARARLWHLGCGLPARDLAAHPEPAASTPAPPVAHELGPATAHVTASAAPASAAAGASATAAARAQALSRAPPNGVH
jgi:hypothetical protein